MTWGDVAWLLVPALIVAALVFRRCFGRLPSLEGRTVSMAVTDTHDTRLGRALTALAADHPGKSGIHPLPDGRDAFTARALLAAAAERTLDVQYYIWHKDMSGTLLFEALHGAAGRNVRVRLLLDDNNTPGLDPTLAALDAHPNIEVRLFNPFVIRRPRAIGYLTDFFRLNRRMHNKSFTADNQATIIGGRNVGDEYFDAAAGTLFADLDVLAIGPVVGDVSRDFDRYWMSASAYPIDRLVPPADAVAIAQLSSVASLVERDPAARDYIDAIRDSGFARDLVEGRLAMEWAVAHMISDDPAKGLGLARPKTLLAYKLKQAIGVPERELKIVSPYFVPTASGVRAFAAMARRGVQISVLTNSLEATDVAAVHAGYAKRRKPLLRMGAAVYETQRFAAPPRARRHRRRRPGSGSAGGSGGIGSSGKAGSSGVIGSSGSSLHAKTMSVDGARAFIGSFNFDPRSDKLNTELGFVIESPALARRIASVFTDDVLANAYQVHLAEDGALYWTGHREGRLVRYDIEPGTSVWKRLGVTFLSLLPIDWLL